MREDDAPQADPPTPAIMQLEVTSGLEFPINDMFDGVPVSFPPGVTVTISPEAALHLFGYPGEAKDMAVHMARRFGWSGRDFLTPQGGHGPAPYEKMAAQIVIKPVYYDLVRRDRDAPILADPDGDDGGDLEPVAGPEEGATKAGKRRRSTARPAPKIAPRTGRKRREVDTADVRLGKRR